jgi:Tfp pilus assembly protein PilN
MLSVVLVLSILSLALPLTAAADLKPIVTVSFSGYSELKADVETFGKLSGRPELAQLLEGMLAMVTEGKGLNGLDQKQPLGAVVLSDGSEDFTIYGFVPVSDLKQLMELMKNPVTNESPKAENGVYEIPAGADSVYVKQQGKWAYVVQKKETFSAVPTDPAGLLGEMPKKYLLAVRASVKNIPDSLKQKALDFLPMLMQASMQPDMVKQNVEQIERLSKELDEVTLGINLDRQTNSFYLDLELTAKPGTNLAAQLAAMKPGKTDFAGLKMPGAAITVNGTTTISDEDVARAKKSLDMIHATAQEGLKDQDLSKEQLDLATDVLNQLFDVAAKTIEMKKTDYGMMVVLEPDALTVAAGSIVADGAKLQKILMKLLAEAEKDDPEAAKLVKLDVETYKGIHFNAFSMPTPDQKLVALVGDTLDVVLGIGDNKVFVAVGRDADKTIKEAIDKSQSEAGKEIPASQIVLSGLKIAKFVSAVADDEQVKTVADKMVSALEQSGGKDHLTIVTGPIPNGARVRLEFEEGILKALGGIQPTMPMGQ